MRKGFLIGLALVAAPALASDGQIEYRQHVYTAIGGHMKAMVDILQQKVSHTDQLALHAGAIAELAGVADTLFPAGSEGGDALPEIWSNPDDFAKRLTTFREAATALTGAIAAGEGVAPAFQALGGACKGCHDNYRAE